MAPLVISKSILALRLDDLQVPHHLLSTIKDAVQCTSQRLLVLVFCENLNADNGISHTGSWDVVQRFLSVVYVEATRVAQEEDRILMEVDVLLRGLDQKVLLDQGSWDHVFLVEGDATPLPLPSWIHAMPTTKFDVQFKMPQNPVAAAENQASSCPSTYPVVALGGTFDHLHSGHKILLSMAAWIASEKVIVGVTDDVLLQKKSNKEVLEKLSLRVERVREFLALFKPELVLDVVSIDDVYGPTAVDPNIQALVVSKETLNGASAIAKRREEKELPALACFVIDVVSASSANLEYEDVELLRKAKLSSTFIREWIVRKQADSAGQ